MGKRHDLTRRTALAAIAAAAASPALAQPPRIKGPGIYDPDAPAPTPAPGSKTGTPGVYINELDAFPNSAVQVDTACTGFVGYTQKRPRKTGAMQVSSFAEYTAYFGGHDTPKVRLINGEPVFTRAPALLSRSVAAFFTNGGDKCMIASAGGYGAAPALQSMLNALSRLEPEKSIALLAAPDAMRLSRDDSAAFQRAMLVQAGREQDRFAVLDVWGADGKTMNPEEAGDAFRRGIGQDGLAFGAAYLPFGFFPEGTRVTFADFADRKQLSELLLAEFNKAPFGRNPDALRAALRNPAEMDDASLADTSPAAEAERISLHSDLIKISPLYSTLIAHASRKLSLLPPSGAMAGLFARTDNEQGVWKAPANRSVVGLVEPSTAISEREQDFYVRQEPALNPIRTFANLGPLVWGARTLAVNDLERTYINIQRTRIMIEQSIKYGIAAYVFQPNDANTWMTVKSMVDNFLNSLWKQGALVGGTPDQAFAVQIGLGSTMTAQDVSNGVMIVSAQVALARPAEFVAFEFRQKMTAS
ncbi:MAG: hypothetical protein B7Y90_17945 [Alphaproteobacteria bacterium 32-64-14]|nr:MAG: hypothetical protein B7Y90_17945 [Alphaproteobacteria bacterium 32-64-14]